MSFLRNASTLALLAIAGLFVISGVGFWNDILLFPKLAGIFGIDYPHARWILALYSLGYLVFALPSALFHRKYGYKTGIILALCLVSVGPFLVYPALTHNGIAFFLVAVVMLGAGWAALETSLNPLAMEMGQPETAIRRLNFFQAFFPVGVVVGYVCGRWLYPSSLPHSYNALAEQAARPYVLVGLAVLALAFLIEQVGFPKHASVRAANLPDARAELRSLIAQPPVRIGALALFCCIAIQSTLQGATYTYVVQEHPHVTPGLAENAVFANLIIFGLSRLAGTALMGRIDPNRLFAWSAGLCLLFAVGALVLGGVAGFLSLTATNLFLGIGYPTVFATTMRAVRGGQSVAAGLLVTASGFAGLVIPLAMNFAIDLSSARAALLVALPCFPLLFVYARAARAANSNPAAPAR